MSKLLQVITPPMKEACVVTCFVFEDQDVEGRLLMQLDLK